MNPVEYLSAVKSLLLNSPLVARHQILREYEGLQKSYIRARFTFTDESTLEFSEYIFADVITLASTRTTGIDGLGADKSASQSM